MHYLIKTLYIYSVDDIYLDLDAIDGLILFSRIFESNHN